MRQIMVRGPTGSENGVLSQDVVVPRSVKAKSHKLASASIEIQNLCDLQYFSTDVHDKSQEIISQKIDGKDERIRKISLYTYLAVQDPNPPFRLFFSSNQPSKFRLVLRISFGKEDEPGSFVGENSPPPQSCLLIAGPNLDV
jgi:hypothetical protein